MPNTDPWPHAPPHALTEHGSFIITAATYQHQHFFNSPDRLDLVMQLIFQQAGEAQIRLHAWAILSNHYHIVADFSETEELFDHRKWLGKLHGCIGREINRIDNTPGRRAMYQFWETRLTYEKSWMARLHYVHCNPVRHGVVHLAADYPWCSARWFETNARSAFVKSVYSFKIDRLSVPDDF